MKNAYTFGKLAVSVSGYLHYAGEKSAANELKINSPWVAGGWDGDEEASTNMRRLAACWNACESLSTEQVEQIDGLLPAKLAYQIMQRDRNALLGALVALHKVCVACDLEKPEGDVQPPTEEQYNEAMDEAERVITQALDADK